MTQIEIWTLSIIIDMKAEAKGLFSLIENIQTESPIAQKKLLALTMTDDSILIACEEETLLTVESFSQSSYAHTGTKQFEKDNPLVGEMIMLRMINGSYFFVFTKPFSLCMCYKDSNKLVPISLNQNQLPFQGFSCQIEFPKIYLFGGKAKDKGKGGYTPSRSLIEIDMYTFQVNKVDLVYGPAGRFNHICHLAEDRIYVFGGMGCETERIKDDLIWTYDLDKKCWFGIELIGPQEQFSSTNYKVIQFAANKVILLCTINNRMYTLSLSQSSYSLQKSSVKDLGSILVGEKCIKKQNRYECPIIDKEFRRLLIFQKYQEMIDYQISNSFLS